MNTTTPSLPVVDSYQSQKHSVYGFASGPGFGLNVRN